MIGSLSTTWLVSVRCLLVVACLLTAACGGGDGDRITYETSCELGCSRAHQCNSALDQEACTMECIDDAEAIGPRLSAGFLAALDDCIETRSCPQLAAAAIFGTCQREAAARVAPSPAAEDLCQAVVTSIQQCTGITVGTAGCLDAVKIFSDPALSAARQCEARPCDQRTACLQTELGIDPTAPR